MKNFNHFIICFIIVIVSFFLSFYLVFTDSFCLAQESYLLDQSAFEVLEGGANGQNGAYSESSSFGINADPNMIVFGIDNIISDINTKLYNKYGWDLETMSWVVEDSMTQAVKDQVNHNLALGATIGQGFMLYESSAINALTGAKDYILGKVDETSGKISDVYNNVYTYISDSFINKFLNVKSDLILDNDIQNLSSLNLPLYGKSFNLSSGNERWILNFTSPVYLYTVYDPSSSTSRWQPRLVYSSSYSCTGTYISGNSVRPFNSITLSGSPTSFTINGVTYTSSSFFGTGVGSMWTDITFGSSLQSVKDLITLSSDTAFSYNSSDYQVLYALLQSLKNSWVTTDDLRLINTKLDELTLGNISINGQNNRVIDTSSESLADLYTLINSILQNNADISLALDQLNNNSGGNNGGSGDDDDDYPTSIPSSYWPSFFPDLLPEDMFSMFRPIFDIVGTSYSMYGLWILIPSILIFVLVLYILVSLF